LRSAAEVTEALQRLDAAPEVDVIVIARGGGSAEDLLPFSDDPGPGLRQRPVLASALPQARARVRRGVMVKRMAAHANSKGGRNSTAM
jgi:Exonuclease VII, large subunit